MHDDDGDDHDDNDDHASGPLVVQSLTWMTTRARPLKAERNASVVEAGTSGSWHDASPLPTPMIRPGPSSENVTLFIAVGTILPQIVA
jgi:hypothetical protein